MDPDTYSGITSINSTRLGWIEGPNRRGTLSILVSCIFTLIVCTWSAIHLNIPRRNASDASYMKTQALWSLLGMFGPELAIWSAWRQYMSAKALRDQVRSAVFEVNIPFVVL